MVPAPRKLELPNRRQGDARRATLAGECTAAGSRGRSEGSDALRGRRALPEPFTGPLRDGALPKLRPRRGSSGRGTKRQRELPERSRSRSRRRARSEAEPSEQIASAFFGGGGLDPAHRPAAAGAGIGVRSEHMSEQPAPAFSRSRLVILGRARQRPLGVVDRRPNRPPLERDDCALQAHVANVRRVRPW